MSTQTHRLARTPGQYGAEIRRARRARGLTQAELAERSGVSRRWLGQLERGHPGAQAAQTMRVMRALGLALRLEPDPDPG